MAAARRTPMIAAFPKMLFPFLVILPGMVAMALTANAGASGFALPAKPDGSLNYDMAIPMMLAHYFPTGLLGLGLTALLASFMSGMAGNVTAFNTVWTYDIYQSYIRRHASDAHYLWVGRMATVFGIALSVAAAYAATRFNNIMDMLQLVFAFVNAPLFATFLLGMFWKRATGHGAFTGLLAGTLAATAHHRADAAAQRGRGHQGGLDRDPARVSERDGAELLDRHLCVDGLLRRDHRREPGDAATPRCRTGGAGLLADRAAT
jgi:SSS family solute:Na+ symporter